MSSISFTGPCSCCSVGFKAWYWGRNFDGQNGSGVGDGVTYIPTQIGSDSDWTSILVGAFGGAIGIKSDGTIWFWGKNFSGQNGNGVADGLIYAPMQIGSDSDWAAISLNNFGGVIGLKSDGTIWFWGASDCGQDGRGSGGGGIYTPTQIGTDSDWVAISLGDNIGALGLKSDGTIWFWGTNYYGQNGNGVADGLIYAPMQIGSDSDWATISLGPFAGAMGLKSDGTIWFWGGNFRGQDGSGVSSSVIYVPTQIGFGVDWVYISINDVGGVIGLKSDGTIWFWGTNSWGGNGSGAADLLVHAPMQIGSDSDWAAISLNNSVGALGLKSDGTIWFWGVNTYGQNGSGSGDFVVYAPMQIGVDFDWDSACINETAVIAIKP